jgi:hypothetical protein
VTNCDVPAAEIETAILAVLDETGEELVRWSTVRSGVPGDFWCTAEALHRLQGDGRVYLIKIKGRPYVCLGDDADAELAAIARAQNRSRPVRVLE